MSEDVIRKGIGNTVTPEIVDRIGYSDNSVNLPSASDALNLPLYEIHRNRYEPIPYQLRETDSKLVGSYFAVLYGENMDLGVKEGYGISGSVDDPLYRFWDREGNGQSMGRRLLREILTIWPRQDLHTSNKNDSTESQIDIDKFILNSVCLSLGRGKSEALGRLPINISREALLSGFASCVTYLGDRRNLQNSLNMNLSVDLQSCFTDVSLKVKRQLQITSLDQARMRVIEAINFGRISFTSNLRADQVKEITKIVEIDLNSFLSPRLADIAQPFFDGYISYLENLGMGEESSEVKSLSYNRKESILSSLPTNNIVGQSLRDCIFTFLGREALDLCNKISTSKHELYNESRFNTLLKP